MVNFETKSEAIKNGYRIPNDSDIDISGNNSFGYIFQDKQGNKSIMVSLTKTKNRMGYLGAYAPMFPPNQ